MVEVYTIPQQRNPKQPVRLNVQVLCVVIVMSLVLEEELLGNNISGKGNGRYAEAREGALETVEAGEGTGVSPLLISRPGVAFCAVGRGGGELLGIEAGDGGAWCHCEDVNGPREIVDKGKGGRGRGCC